MQSAFMKKSLLLTSLNLLIAAGASAQYQNLKFEHITTADGLSSSTGIEIFQDSRGFMWFGTIDGLNRYDGYSCEVYRPVLHDPHSISDTRINTITEDKDGRLWIGTDNGLNLFDPGRKQFFRFNHRPGNPRSLSSNVVYDLLFDAETGILWIATQKGLNTLDLSRAGGVKPGEVVFGHYFHEPGNAHSLDHNQVTGILVDQERTLWAVTSGRHLDRYDLEKDRFERILIDIDEPEQLDHIPKVALVDRDGDFWIGNNLSALILWDRQNRVFSKKAVVPEQDIPIFDLYQDKHGTLWIATDGQGIFLLDKDQGLTGRVQHNPFNPFSLSNDQPSKIYEDRRGMIWITTYNTGINKLAFNGHDFGHYFHQPGNPGSLGTRIAQAVMQDSRERIWIGTDGGGLDLFDPDNGSFTHFRNRPEDASSLSSDKILYLRESRDGGDIWVCTWDGGLNKFNPETGQFTRYRHRSFDPFSIGQNTVFGVVEDRQGRLWAGTQAGLNLMDPETERFYQYVHDPDDPRSLPADLVISLFIDSKDRLFAGTTAGLCWADLKTTETGFPPAVSFNRFRDGGLGQYRINTIREDRKGNIWVASDGGLYRLNPGLAALVRFTTLNGLPNNVVMGVQEDDEGQIWITTKSGLSRLDPATGRFRNFNTRDGLQGMEFQREAICKTADGQILAGGINGFNIFHPGRVGQEAYPPDLRLTRFMIYNREVRMQDTVNGRVLLERPLSRTKAISLTYKEDYISLEFVGLYYANPAKVKYAYMLEGLDAGWNEVGNQRSAVYSSLPPGDYTFKLKAAGNGTWTPRPLTLVISMAPPPWKTWWAWCLYILLALLALAALMGYFVQRIRVEKELELDQMKLTFFTNVAHEFRTPLTLILSPVDRILSSSSGSSEVTAAAQTIQRSARRLLNLVNQLLDFRKVDLGKAPLEMVRGDVVSFSRDIFVLFRDLAGMKHLDFRFEEPGEPLIMYFDPDKLEKILTNLLSNAIKFTGPGGRVILAVSRAPAQQARGGFFRKATSGESAEFRVSDTGPGIRKEQLQYIFKRFFHADAAKTGTGIGLNFTKSLVELHGGRISVESEYGKGSTFTVRLPVLEKPRGEASRRTGLDTHTFDTDAVKAAEYEVSIGELDAGAEEEPAGQGERGDLPVLLIVEDNRELRLHLKNELRNRFKIREAANGAEGFEKVLKYYPDIVISDVMMPEMDGFELCRKIKTSPETAHIPVILLTARSLEEDQIEGYETGADAYLPKPFNITLLKVRLKNLLESRRKLKEKFLSMGGIVPASELTTNTLDEAFLDKVTRTVLEHIDDPGFSLERLLELVGVSRSHFFRKIHSITGQNPSHFIRTIRLKHAASLLSQQQHSIKEVSFMAGFNSPAYFSKTFRELFGQTPQEYMASRKRS